MLFFIKSMVLIFKINFGHIRLEIGVAITQYAHPWDLKPNQKVLL